jgi:plastocyanin
VEIGGHVTNIGARGESARALARMVVATIAAGVVAGCSSPAPEQSAAPARAAAPASVPVSSAGLTSVTGQASSGAVVVLEPATPQQLPPPAGPAVMDQRGQQFIPSLLVARTGQPVEFRNGESIVHNVYVTRRSTGSEVLNVGTDPGQSHTHTFDQTGQYEVSCDIHPGMQATIVVVSSPYVAVGDGFGNFAIVNVPPGSYTLKAMSGGSSTGRIVEVTGTHTDVGKATS